MTQAGQDPQNNCARWGQLDITIEGMFRPLSNQRGFERVEGSPRRDVVQTANKPKMPDIASLEFIYRKPNGIRRIQLPHGEPCWQVIFQYGSVEIYRIYPYCSVIGLRV